ncbi:hypothetical protein AGMMS49992_33560 [Clostridia bacterium]|nr:hypothetical protein AGMMS49992_33560 [Clostridia bacterium]
MDEYKDYVKMCADMFKEKLLDPDIFVMKTQEVTAKGSTATQVYGSLLTSAAFATVGEANANAFVPAPIFTAANGKQMWYTRQFANPGVGVITSACKYPEAAVRWCDLFFDAEYEKLVWMGQEGEAYEYVDDTRTMWNWIFTDDAPTSTEVRAKRTIQADGQGPSICPVEWFNLNDAVEAPVNVQRRDVATEYFGKLRLAMPIMYYDANDQRELNTVWTDVSAYMSQEFALFVTGQKDIDANWDTFIKTLKNMGAETIVTVAQKTYDAAK